METVDTVATTRWLTLNNIHYRDRFGRSRQWNAVSRTTKTDQGGLRTCILFDNRDGVPLKLLCKY